MTSKYIANPSSTIEIINKYKFAFQKRFGQNFLIDTHVLDKIISASNINSDDLVLEIGPGIGSMTQYLLENSKKVIAVEIDKVLIPILEDTLSSYQNLKLINEDILKLDINQLLKDEDYNSKIKVVANLPYYITTPIIMKLFEDNVPIQSITIMVQKEVAERMQAKPGTKNYGALSLAVQYYSIPKIIANVPPNCFIPRPSVGSAVIQLTGTKPDTSHLQDKKLFDEKLMFKIIRASFNQRRKTLINSLNNSQQINISKDTLLKILENMNLPSNIRGEALSLEQFMELSNQIYKSK